MMDADHCRHCSGRDGHGEHRTPVENLTWSEKLKETDGRPSPWGPVTDLTPGVAVGRGTLSLSVGFKKSKIEMY